MPDDRFPSESDDIDLDDTRLCCPSCGCAAEVLRMPRPGAWFNASGLAECDHCHRRFAIEVAESPPEPPRQPSPWQWLRDLVDRADPLN